MSEDATQIAEAALNASTIRWESAGLGTAHFGAGGCFLETENARGEAITLHLGWHIWPVAVCADPESGAVSIRLRYLARDGKAYHVQLPAALCADKSSRNKGAALLLGEGVQLSVDHGGDAVRALGHWSLAQDISPTQRPYITLANRNGWYDHNTVYVQGSAIYGKGAEQWEADADSEAIRRRSARSGNLSDWLEVARDVYNTVGLRAGIGLALVGAILQPLNLQPWGIHAWCTTSRGKTTVADVIASVWGQPSETRSQWDGTPIGMQGVAQAMDAACLIMDEMGMWKGGTAELSQTIYSLAQGSARNRANRDGSLQHRKTWRTTLFSTGEMSVADRLGDEMRGGHGVRLIDVELDGRSWTRSGDHSRQCVSATQRVYGVLGGAWVAHLTRDKDALTRLVLNASTWFDAMRAPDMVGQEDRILKHLSYLYAVLVEACGAGLLPWSAEECAESARWLTEIAFKGRIGRRSPEEHAWSRLWQEIEAQPILAPTVEEIIAANMPPRELWGVWVDDVLWVTQDTLRPFCARLSLSPQILLSWAVDNGHAGRLEGCGKSRLPGTRTAGAVWNRRWVKLTPP